MRRGWSRRRRRWCGAPWGSLPAPKLQARSPVNVRPRLGAQAGRKLREPRDSAHGPAPPASGHRATGYRTGPSRLIYRRWGTPDSRTGSGVCPSSNGSSWIPPALISALVQQTSVRQSATRTPAPALLVRAFIRQAPLGARAVPTPRGQTAVESAPGVTGTRDDFVGAAGVALDPPFLSWCMLVGCAAERAAM